MGPGTDVNLVCAILAVEQVDPVLDALAGAGHRATRVSSTGGFLRRGNTTLLIGVNHDQLGATIALIHDACRGNTARDGAAGCATVFVLPVERFQQA